MSDQSLVFETGDKEARCTSGRVGRGALDGRVDRVFGIRRAATEEQIGARIDEERDAGLGRSGANSRDAVGNRWCTTGGKYPTALVEDETGAPIERITVHAKGSKALSYKDVRFARGPGATSTTDEVIARRNQKVLGR